MQTQVRPHLRHMVELSEAGGDSSSEVYNFHQPGVVSGGAVSVDRQAVSYTRDD